MNDIVSDSATIIELETSSALQSRLGLVSWGGYVFHCYNEMSEDREVELSQYPVPYTVMGTSTYVVTQNKIVKPIKVTLDISMSQTEILSTKQLVSAPMVSYSLSTIQERIVSTATSWDFMPNPLCSGLMTRLEIARKKGWALTYNGKYGKVPNMLLKKIVTKDSPDNSLGMRAILYLEEVWRVQNHRTSIALPTCKAV